MFAAAALLPSRASMQQLSLRINKIYVLQPW